MAFFVVFVVRIRTFLWEIIGGLNVFFWILRWFFCCLLIIGFFLEFDKDDVRVFYFVYILFAFENEAIGWVCYFYNFNCVSKSYMLRYFYSYMGFYLLIVFLLFFVFWKFLIWEVAVGTRWLWVLIEYRFFLVVIFWCC